MRWWPSSRSRRPGREDLDHPARGGRARLHPAAADRGPVSDDARRAARPARRAPRRPRRRGDRLRRRLDRRPGRSPARHRPGAPHGHPLRDEREPGPRDVRGTAAGPLPRRSLAARKEYSEETAAAIDAEIRKLLGGRPRASPRDPDPAAGRARGALARLLIEKEVVDRETLGRLLARSGLGERAAEGA